MIREDLFEIKRLVFTDSITDSFNTLHYAKDLWPVVYILSDGTIKEAYVGETTDLYARTNAHLKSSAKNKLTVFHLIASTKFNKSATLDIESNLIKYISGDGQYRLINANVGLANHTYYQKKEVYWDVFKSIWHKLKAEGIAKHSIEHIDNSDLFKYSPYKSLTKEQSNALLCILKNLLNDNIQHTIVEGGAGTGKTILAVFLFKLLNSNDEGFNYKEFGDEEEEFIKTVKHLKLKYENPKMALVVPMSSFRNTLKKVFKNVKGLNAGMVVGPSEIANDRFDIILVDESHRLRRRVNLTNFRAFDDTCVKLGLEKFKCTELDWVVHQSERLILFYDENQSVKPSDVLVQDFIRLKMNPGTNVQYLRSQLRVKGGKDYVQFVYNLLDCSIPKEKGLFNSDQYSFLLFDSIEGMRREIEMRDQEHHLSRIIAGYAWPWKSKKNKALSDIQIGETSFRWNSVSGDWINSPNAVKEVGCIHTTQGYDLNFAGIIFGNEITYDKNKNAIIIQEDDYYDRNGKSSIKDPIELKAFITNIYKTIMLRGIKGTYVYACDKNMREYLRKYIPLAATKIYPPVISNDKTSLSKSVPLYDLNAAAGNFGPPQNVTNHQWVELPPYINFDSDLFACRVVGDSMNKVIPNGSLCLFKKYEGGSRNGKIVLVRHSNIQEIDLGSGYTVKEYRSKISVNGDQWHHESITLYPLSGDPSYNRFEISPEQLRELRVIGIFLRVLS